MSQGGGLPAACGALGKHDPAALGRIAAGFDRGLGEVARTDAAVLYLDREPIRWRAPDGSATGLAWPERAPSRAATAGGWREASDAGCCGVFLESGLAGIHASDSGIAPLYWMRVRECVYFSTRLDPLARAGIAPLSADWQTWSEMLVLGNPLEGRTTFAEIGRLDRGAAIQLSPADELRHEPSSGDWTAGPSLTREEAAEGVAAGILAQVEGLESPAICALTAGWDSRVIAAALSKLGLAERGLTTDSDYGDDFEERTAGEVAAHLGLAHEVARPDLPSFEQELAVAAERTEYQSLPHLVIHRFASVLPPGQPVTDGWGGNFLKGRVLRPEILSHRRPAEGSFDSFVPEMLPALYAEDAWAALRSRTLSAFLRGAEPYRGHPHEPILAMQPRWYRSVGTSPATIVGRRNPPVMPLAATAVANVAIRAPVEDRRSGSLYREVLERLSPGLGAIPSSNDGIERQRQHRPRFRSREAREAHRALLLRSPLRPWFGPRFERWIERGKMAKVDDFPRRVQRMHGICIFTLWAERYRDLIGEPDPSEMFR